MSSIFSKIISGDIPSTKVYEDEKCLAFLDIRPVSKGHTLLIPKDEYVWMTDTPDELIAYLFVKAKELMIKMKENLGVELVDLFVEGLDVPHFHIHLIPTMKDEKIVKREHTEYKEGEAIEIAKKIIGG